MGLDMKGFVMNNRCSGHCMRNAQPDWSVVLAEKSKLRKKIGTREQTMLDQNNIGNTSGFPQEERNRTKIYKLWIINYYMYYCLGGFERSVFYRISK